MHGVRDQAVRIEPAEWALWQRLPGNGYTAEYGARVTLEDKWVAMDNIADERKLTATHEVRNSLAISTLVLQGPELIV